MIAGLAWPLLVLLGAAAGAAFGSFAALAFDRGRRGVSIVRPGSACVACGRRVRPHENVPIVSWLLLGGRCRGCRARIPLATLLCETLGAGLGAGLALLLLR